MTDILMPALSPTMEEGTLAKWHVKPGDKVSSGDVITEIETDKATMEVEAVDEGVVDEILVPEGTEEVKVNTPIARLKGDGAASSPPKAAAPPAPPSGGRNEAEAAPAPSAPPPTGEELTLQLSPRWGETAAKPAWGATQPLHPPSVARLAY